MTDQLYGPLEQVKKHAQHGDHLNAHFHEDALMRLALELIAAGVANPAGVAKVALSTQSLSFERWHA